MGMGKEVKLLFENWRRCLKEWVDDTDVAAVLDDEAKEEPEEKLSEEEESIVRHNLRALDTMGGPPAIDRLGFGHLDEEALMDVVGGIPTLRRSKIVKAIGAGTKKTVYK